jgi:aminopeptidase N
VSKEYSGLTELTFELTSLPKLLPIDFVSSKINDLVVNGYNVAPLLYGEFLLIPRIYLNLGVNNIAVNYSNQFNNDGLGCLSFIDTSGAGDTSKYYVYTQFEPYSAHRLIPCFDQPDLKATLSLNIILPSDWISVANGPQNYTAVYDEIDYVKHAPSQN